MSSSLAAQHVQFRTQLEAHPEIGGAHLEAAQQNAVRALDRFLPATSPEGQQLRTAMNKSGYGDYAPLVVLLSRIGKAMAEDRPIGGGGGAGGVDPRPTADVLFPSTVNAA